LDWTHHAVSDRLVLFGYRAESLGNALGTGWLHGLKVAAVAAVAQGVLSMMRSLAPDRERTSLAVLMMGNNAYAL
jgi:chromate transporter